MTGVDVATPVGLAINTDNSSPSVTVNGGTVCFVSAAGINGAGATAGKAGRGITFRLGDGGTSGSGLGGDGGSFGVDIGNGGAGGGGSGTNGSFTVTLNGVTLLTILGQTTDVYVGENSKVVYIGGSNTGGGTNTQINIGQAGCDDISFGNNGGNCFLNMLGHIQVDGDYNAGISVFTPEGVAGNIGNAGAIAVYRGNSLVGYIPVVSVA